MMPTVATATRRLQAEEAPLAEAPHVLGTILDRDAPLGAARDQLDACLSADQMAVSLVVIDVVVGDSDIAVGHQ